MTLSPLVDPTVQPSVSPTLVPSASPTRAPVVPQTMAPTLGDGMTLLPLVDPTVQPSVSPTLVPSATPTRAPVVPQTMAPTLGDGMTLSPIPDVTVSPSTPVVPAPSIAAMVVTPDLQSLTVRVSLEGSSVAGRIYCAAFSAPRTLSSISEITSQGYFADSSSSSTVDVVVRSLTASTAFWVYCTTVSTAGASLSLASTQATARQSRTRCCRTVTIKILRPSAVMLMSVADAISVTIDARPVQLLQVTLVLPGSSTYPTSVSWSNTTTEAMSRNFIVNAGPTVGMQQLSAVLSGAAAADYDVIYEGNRNITITRDIMEPDVPLVEIIRFSNDGTYVSIIFNAPTNQGGFGNSFPCAQLLSFSGSATSACQWADSATIRTFPQAASSSSLLTVGAEVTVLGGKITADCSAADSDVPCDFWQRMPAVTALVNAPDQPTAPVVSISAPASISACNSLTVDLAGSSGSAGRSWSNVAFRVSVGDAVTPGSREVQNFLNQNYTLNPPTPVPSTLLQADTTYIIQTTLCNFLDACSSNMVSVLTLASQNLIPTVSIVGASQRSIIRRATLTLTSNAFIQACGGSPSYSNLDLTWTITSSTGDASVASIRSSSVDPSVFRLAPFTLNVGHQYSVLLTVRSRLSGLSSTAAVAVTVPASNLVAKITGGAQRSLKYESSFTLDASRSYDEDVQGLFGVKAGLSYTWSCSQTFPEVSDVCPLQLLPSGPDSSWERPTIVAPLVALNTTSILTVTVRDASMQRSSTAQVSVKVAGFVPAELIITFALESVASINTDNKLVLYGSVQTLAPCTAVWSVDDATLLLSQVTTTPTSVVLPASVRPAAFNLVPVEVSKISESEQRNALLLLVKSGTGSVDSVKNIISVVSAAMNSVNCSAAPNCTEINRNPCSKTSGECGTCIDGYIGDYGDRSTLCIPASFAHSNSTDAVCSTQVDCLSWQECDSVRGICVSPQKRCSKDCSDNGECLYASLVTGDTLSTCSLADLTCAAACSCSDGFSGPTCATPLSDLQSR
eukprot:gene21074-23917_t